MTGEPDKIARVNRARWEEVVRESAGCTRPYLDLDVDAFRAFREGTTTTLPEPCLEHLGSEPLMRAANGSDVLCLAAGGGQQSALFALLGARVTVFDLSDGQLEGDRTAAAHYGYAVTTIQGDMRDMSALAADSFDLVYGTGTAFVPDVAQVFGGVARVIRRGGLYRPDFANPYTEFVDYTDWDGTGYRITLPYAQRERHDDMLEFRSYLDEVFNGLINAGFLIRRVFSAPTVPPARSLTPGSYAHWEAFLSPGYAVLAQRELAGL